VISELWGRMLSSCALGIIVGLLGAIALATTLVSIYQALSRRQPAAVHIASVLGLPLFYGGGSWARTSLIPADEIQRGAGVYLLMIMLTLVVVNAWPCFKLIQWAANTIGREAP
jgi:hypothetical protein